MLLENELFIRKREYVSIYQQEMSPCGRYLAVCDSYGLVSVFQLSAAISVNTVEDTRKPLFSFQAYDNSPCYTMITVGEDFLVTGGVGPLKAFSWKEIIRRCKLPSTERSSSNILTECWNLPLEQKRDTFDDTECNCLVFDDTNNVLYAACGNDLIQRWNLEDGRGSKAALKGHTDYVQWLSLAGGDSNQTLASVSEDGTAKVWDLRTSSVTKSFCPSKRRELVRPEFGPWLTCVSMDASNQWLVCGGGPTMSVWHVPSGELSQVVPIQGATQHFLSFDNVSGEITVGSSDKSVYTYSVNGSRVRKVQCSVPVVYHALKSDRVTQLMTVSGQSSKVDVFTNPGYVAFSLNIRV